MLDMPTLVNVGMSSKVFIYGLGGDILNQKFCLQAFI